MSHNCQEYKRLLFIGSGKIANAVACGLVNSKSIPPEFVTVYNRNSDKFAGFNKYGIKTTMDLKEASFGADIIFLAVKPMVVSKVVNQLVDLGCDLESKLLVSFAASVTIEHIVKACGREVPVIRTMPSTPILVGEGVLAVSKNECVSQKDFQSFCRLMSSIAHVSVMNEELMNPIISVHGSSPAYVYLFVKSMLDGAEKQGIDREIALPLILKTIKGSVTMIEQSDKPIEALISDVCSPNGTTLAALNSFESDGFKYAIERAMSACTKRANEISEEL